MDRIPESIFGRDYRAIVERASTGWSSWCSTREDCTGEGMTRCYGGFDSDIGVDLIEFGPDFFDLGFLGTLVGETKMRGAILGHELVHRGEYLEGIDDEEGTFDGSPCDQASEYRAAYIHGLLLGLGDCHCGLFACAYMRNWCGVPWWENAVATFADLLACHEVVLSTIALLGLVGLVLVGEVSVIVALVAIVGAEIVALLLLFVFDIWIDG